MKVCKIENLVAVVHYYKTQSGFMTNIKIRLGSVDIAHATKGGKYTQQQALAEFKHNPNSFTFLNEADKGLVRLVA